MPWIPVSLVEGITCYRGTRIPLPCKQPLKRPRGSRAGWVEMEIPVEPVGEPLSTCKDLILADPGQCPRCGSEYTEFGGTQLPLFFHGGYGEATTTVSRGCATCGTSVISAVRAVNPREAILCR